MENTIIDEYKMLVKNELTKNDILNNDLKESIQVLLLAKQGLFAKARDKSNKINKEDLSSFELAILDEADLLYLVKKNKYDEALTLARRIKEGNPNGYFTNLYLTQYYENKKNWIGANDCNLLCLEINPNNVNLILESARIKWHLAKKDKAFESLAQINNKTTQFLAKLALITGDGWGRVLYILGVGLTLILSRFSLYFFVALLIILLIALVRSIVRKERLIMLRCMDLLLMTVFFYVLTILILKV